MVVPEGFVLPPWYVVVPLAVVLLGTVALLWVLAPPVTDETVMAFVPWMMLGSTLYVLYQLEQFPSSLEALFSAPTVYVTTAAVAGLTWIAGSFLYAAGLQRSIERFVGIVGTGFAVVFATFTVLIGWQMGTFEPFWPVITVVVTGVVAAIAWVALSLWRTDVAAVTGVTGALVVFSHALDGVSTAIGYDILGVREDVPASAFILEVGEMLPTAGYIGGGWLFVLVKVVLALIIVSLFEEYVREEPRQARIVLGLIAAVGLGPGVHNILLFTVGVGA
ncbi:DUF63 family protein [Natronosalvus halobius]|uniref:DUF63 family protein n=1 Tax=Natronosalvus halobius TaxID=2953746 RepID=UPI0020A18575|nr:DUF63 family protein [Natronosalvus halobius]USZ73304.1 DUF63 family protein [Natronosalvus halobius]